jgi:arsenate reductase
LDLPVVWWRRLLSEGIGSLVLTATVVGSGIAAQTLSPHAVGLELLENAAATAGILYALIALLGPVSGAHFNPLVTLVNASIGSGRWREVPGYVITQVVGCSAGAWLANVMFSTPAIEWSSHHRATGAHLVSEVLASAGLVLLIFGLTRSGNDRRCPPAVAAYIGAAYFFTSSTSFANPAITVGRMFTTSFAGIAPSSVAPFIGAQLLGALLGATLVVLLFPTLTPSSPERTLVA